MSFSEFWRSVRMTLWIGLPVAVLLTSALIALSFIPPLARPLTFIEDKLIDYRMERAWDRAPGEHPLISIVTIDDDDLVGYPSSPIPRDFLARVISAIDELAPRAIGLDFLFIKATQPESDQVLLDGLQRVKAMIVIGALREPNMLTDQQREFQRSFVAASGREAGFLNLTYDVDKVIRVAPASAFGGWPSESLWALLAKAGGAGNIPPSFRIAWLRGPDEQHAAFHTIAARSLLKAQATHLADWAALRESLRDRIVLVGGAFANRDQHKTPMAVLTKSLDTGVTEHAQMVAQLLDNRYFGEAGPGLLFGLLLSRSLLGFFAGIRARSRTAISLAAVGGAAGLLLLDARMLEVFRTVFPITLLVPAWVMGFAAGNRLCARAADSVPGPASSG